MPVGWRGADTDLPSDMVAFSECNVTWSCSDSYLQLLNKGLDLLILDMIVDMKEWGYLAWGCRGWVGYL